jgi:hypothetical protein
MRRRADGSLAVRKKVACEYQTCLSAAYTLRSWVKDFVTPPADVRADDEEEDLLIALPG